jgi:hypothetical protein
MIDKFKTAYKWHKSNSAKRKVEFLFTFEEWKNWWIETGKWELRGVGKDKYCMCRIDDKGAYVLGNVYCATNSKNFSDANKGKPKSAETRLKMSQSMTGKAHSWSLGKNNVMHTLEAKAKFSEATSGSKHYRARAVQTPFGIFLSGTEAAKALNVPKPTVYWKCKYQKDGWSFLAIA